MTKERHKTERSKINPIEMNNFHLMKQQQSKHCLNVVSLLAGVEFSEN